MNDLKVIKQIESKFGIRFIKLRPEELWADNRWHNNKRRAAYCFNSKKQVIGLDLQNYGHLHQIGDIISNLNHISHLRIRRSNMSDYSFLHKLKNLRVLELSVDEISDVSLLKQLSGLKSLELSGFDEMDYSSLKDLKGLTSLNLSAINLADVSFLKEMKGLTALDLSFALYRTLPFYEN